MEHESDGNTNCNWRVRYSHRFGIGIRGLGKMMSGDHPNYSNVELGKNTEKRRGDLRRPVVTQNPLENH